MRTLILIITFVGIAAAMTYGQSGSHNYISTQVMQNTAGSQYLETIQYFDGLGREIEQVQCGITPSGQDLVSLQCYDLQGNKTHEWLAVPVSGNGNFADSLTVATAAKSFYSDPNPYVEFVYDDSPLPRLLKTYGAGGAWREADKFVQREYLTNSAANSCNRIYVNAQGALINTPGGYSEGELCVTKGTDEDGHVALKFEDKLGRTVLIRELNGTIKHDTYFVYDSYGLLRYVLPPMMEGGTNLQNIQRYAYYYSYDEYRRCIVKKLPGCEPIYMVYDKAGRLVLTQDGNQREYDSWTVNKYDYLGRLAYTAEVEDATPFQEQTARFNDMLVVENFSVSGQSYPMGNTGYSRVYYHNAPTALLTVNYYDNYNFLSSSLVSSATVSALQYQRRSGYGEDYGNAKGLLTGTRVYSLSDPDSYTLTVFYYDEKGRMIQKRSTNHVGGYDHHYYGYSFDGSLRKYGHDHVSPDGTVVPEYYGYTYDHAGRPLTTGHSFINPQRTQLLSMKSYDELGRLKSNIINTYREAIHYSYNIRGWLTGIDSPNFKENLYYCSSSNGCYNGNIDHLDWKVKDEDFTHHYYFQYDGLNRLIKAEYGSVSSLVGTMSNGYMLEVGEYDKHGNIRRMCRKGLLLPSASPVQSRVIGGQEGGGSGSGGSSNDYYYGVIDDLTLSYNGNRLRNVTDVAAVDPVYKNGMHFFDGAGLLTEYAYDSNGNLTMDKNKYITDISYNNLNLPYSISVSTPTGSVTLPLANKEDLIMYEYDASGKKLNASYACSGPNQTMSFYSSIDYCDNYIYENGTLSKVLLPEGYISIDESQKFRYHYYLKDHQGNNRVVINQGSTAEQVNHYYPFGSLFGMSKEGRFQPYKFGGKELGRVGGLDLYDFEARQYDPVLGRFTSMDPHCEKYYSHSPYGYCNSNPINRVDPDGKDWFQNTLTGSIYYNSSYRMWDVYLIEGEGWEWLGWNGFFNMSDEKALMMGKPYMSYSSTIFPFLNEPGYTKAFFGGKSAESFMGTMGYDRRPVYADVHIHEEIYLCSDGHVTIALPRVDEIIEKVYSTTYVRKGTSSSYVKLGNYDHSFPKMMPLYTPGYTYDTWERRFYRYGTNDGFNINNYASEIFSFFASLVEILLNK